MKISSIFLMAFFIFTLVNSKDTFAENTYRPKSVHTYITGPKGGCYYINKNGKKTYVDRKLCQKNNRKYILNSTETRSRDRCTRHLQI